MSREFWLKLDKGLSTDLKRELLQAAADLCDVILVDESDLRLAQEMKVPALASVKKGDIEVCDASERDYLKLAKESGKRVAVKCVVRDEESLKTALEVASLPPDYLLISCPDWKVIPLENLIAGLKGRCKLIASVESPEEAKLVLETLELGADGVLLKAGRREELQAVQKVLKEKPAKLELVPATVMNVSPLATGVRVCVDTCELLEEDEGMFTGVQSSGFFLVEAEVRESPFTAPRPFRVNAGSISLYTLAPDGKTKYLSELKAGEEIMIVSRDGKTRSATVGRVKIERRPLVLVEAEAQGRRLKTILQHAETIRLITPEGSTPVTELKPGDQVLVKLEEEGGRHFGVLVKEEFVLEK